MIVRKKIFEPCAMEYKEHDKPVRYSEEFLKEIACGCHGADLVNQEHFAGKIGSVSNLSFTDGGLYADIDSETPLDDLEYSPSFNCTLVDYGDHWEATKGSMLEVALTSEPRRAILNNTAYEGGSKMGEKGEDTTKEYLIGEVDKLQKEKAKIEFQLEQANKKVEEAKKLEDEVTELREWKEEKEKVLEEQKPIIEDYKKYQENKREELLEKVSNGNEELKEKYSSFSTENLEILLEAETQEQPPKGAGADNAPGLGEGDGEKDKKTPEEVKKEKAASALEFYKKTHNGESPSFINIEGDE